MTNECDDSSRSTINECGSCQSAISKLKSERALFCRNSFVVNPVSDGDSIKTALSKHTIHVANPSNSLSTSLQNEFDAQFRTIRQDGQVDFISELNLHNNLLRRLLVPRVRINQSVLEVQRRHRHQY